MYAYTNIYICIYEVVGWDATSGGSTERRVLSRYLRGGRERVSVFLTTCWLSRKDVVDRLRAKDVRLFFR